MMRIKNLMLTLMSRRRAPNLQSGYECAHAWHMLHVCMHVCMHVCLLQLVSVSLCIQGAWILEVHLIRAQNLPRLDWAINDSNFIGQSDPFVKVMLVSESTGGPALEQGQDGREPVSKGWRRSKVHKNTLHPDFSESFRFNLLASAPRDRLALHFQVWDWDRFKPNDFSGCAELPVDHMFAEDKAEMFQWCDLFWRVSDHVGGCAPSESKRHTHAHTHTYIHTYTHTHTHTFTHTHTHTHICALHAWEQRASRWRDFAQTRAGWEDGRSSSTASSADQDQPMQGPRDNHR